MSLGTETLTQDREALPTDRPALVRLAPALGLVFVILVGAFVRFYQLGAHSIGNTYYAAAVKSMLTSWHNFFYVAFEPGGSVTVDKPPLGFWVQAASAYVFGVNGFALALPQALAGTLSIPLLYHLVRRHFGSWAGLAAALALALTPITVATERNNTIDGLLVFVLLLAAWAFLKAAEGGRLRHLLLGAVLVGLGFNIKMLQAVMPLPALYALYLLGARHPWWKRALHLGLATVVLLIVGLAWVVAVDLTPAEARPYIGSSTDNTVMELIVGHNGLSRLGLNDQGPNIGPGRSPMARLPAGGQGSGAAGGLGLPPGVAPPLSSQDDLTQRARPPLGDDGPAGQDGPRPRFAPGGGAGEGLAAPDNLRAQDRQPPGQPARDGGPRSGRNSETGAAGPLRLFEEPLVTEASWLLPLALLGVPLVLFGLGWDWPLEKRHLSVSLWAGWLLPSVAYFSFTTGLFHRYYLIMLGPPLAALFGITLWAIWRLWKRGAAWGWTLLLVLSGFTLGFELFTLREYPAYAGPVTIFSALAWLAGTLWLVLASRRAWSRRVGFGLVGLALLIAPFTWSLLTTLNPSPNVALPTAGVGASDRTRATFMTPNQGYLDPAGEAVLAYTLAHTDPEDYLLATNNARGAAPFILETDRAVLTFGGFTGRDNVVDLETFLQMTASGELRFVLGLPQGTPEISRYVLERCTPVELPGLSGDAGLSGEVLYDCAS